MQIVKKEMAKFEQTGDGEREKREEESKAESSSVTEMRDRRV